MLGTMPKKLTLRCCALLLLVGGLFLFTKDSTTSLLASLQERAKLSHASITRQDDAPLRIINTFVESEPEMFRLKITVQDQSLKTIRAYAIVANAGSASRIDFASLTTPTSVFQPTQIKTLEMGFSEDDSPKEVALSMDFVEFEDGSTWGEDLQNSRDRLLGQREGAKAERQRLREVLKSKGLSAAFDAAREEVPDNPEIKTTTKPSEEWLQGYRNGIGSMRHRLRQSLQMGDPARVEQELNRPYDLSEERQK